MFGPRHDRSTIGSPEEAFRRVPSAHADCAVLENLSRKKLKNASLFVSLSGIYSKKSAAEGKVKVGTCYERTSPRSESQRSKTKID